MQAQRRPDVSIVLPCRNERHSVGRVVRESLLAIDQLGLTGEVVVCDNGSIDSSGQLALDAGAKVVHQQARGYGLSVRTALSAASGSVIAVMDADGSYSPHDLAELVLPVMSGEVEYTRGSRFVAAPPPDAMGFARRRIGNPILTALLRAAGGRGWSDGQSGMWAVARATYGRLDLRSEGMEFAHEIVLEIRRVGASTSEIPIGYLPRQGRSKLRPIRDSIRHVRFLCEYAFLRPKI